MSIPQCIILDNDSIYDFDGVFLVIPVKDCIVGMLLTRPITFNLIYLWYAHVRV